MHFLEVSFLSEFICVVQVEDVVIGLQQVVDDPALTQVLDRCHGEATVLGMVNVQQAEDVLKTFHPQACEQEVWLRVEHLVRSKCRRSEASCC